MLKQVQFYKLTNHVEKLSIGWPQQSHEETIETYSRAGMNFNVSIAGLEFL